MPKRFQKIIFTLTAGLALVGFYFFQAERSPGVKGITEDLSGKLAVYFLDVGQGDSTLIRTPEGNDILIDGGPDNKVVQKLGQYLPYGDRDIELIILTHPHSDHVAGLNEVLSRYGVKKILMTGVLHTADDYLDFLGLIKEKNIPVEIVTSTREVALGVEVKFEVLFPDQDFSGRRVENLNNTSMVGQLIYASTSALFTGDMEEEEKLVAKYSSPRPSPPKGEGALHADILKVGHHGSNNANDLAFIEAVSPAYAVISVGQNNSFGHPHYRALKNLEKIGAQVLRTDQDGDVVFVSDGKKYDLLK